ncbi:MAG: F0F1 ATP synthase subunit B [Erysipelotrichaceae bacterium]|nr:F0F1 ATP synthase subunit B [Erysipelotrichaceae bacterium]
MSLNIDIQGSLLPNLVTMISQLLATLLIYLMFRKFLWKPVREILAKRSSFMQSEIDDARKLQEEAKEQLSEAKGELEEARISSRKIIDEARAEARNLSSSIVKTAEENAKVKIAEAEKRIALKEKEANETLREKSVGLAMEAAQKYLTDKSGPEEDYEILKKFIEESEAGK